MRKQWGFIIERFVRVFTPEGIDKPRAGPYWPDVVRDGAAVRKPGPHVGLINLSDQGIFK